MHKKVELEILNSIENDKQSKIIPTDELVNKTIQMMKEFNIDGIIDFNDEQETIKLINLAKQNQDKQTERIKSANEFNFDNINYNKSINNLLEHHTKYKDRNSTDTFLVLFRCIELEDENKKLTLTDEQYKTWLESKETQYITTKQFEILYGLSSRQQKGLRTKINDPLPCVKLLENSNILYNRYEVEKWLENYQGKMHI